MSEILTGGPLKFTEPNCPTRVGEYINTLGDIYSIPNPRLGMQVFVKDEKRTYIVTELKSKTINGVVVPNAQVGEFELLGEKSIAWGASSNINSFTTAGVYNIKGERTNANDNLPISNSNPGHTVSGRLIVLDSSINGTGDSQDKCITQLLTLSNRTGEDGNTYIRTASGASLDSLTWKPWATQQTNVNVGQVTSLDSFIDNGIYSGVLVESGVPSTFVMIVINDYFVGVSPRRVSQLLYKLSKTGEVSYTTRLGVGDNAITWNGWEIINKKELDATAKELLKRIQGTSDNSSASYDPFKRYPTNFSSVADAEFMEALNTMHSADSTSGVDGFWRLYIGRLVVEVKNVAIKYVDDTWVQTIKLPYKWYKSSNKFGIDDDGNHHIHTYYRIHKDGSWGDWIEVEEELKSAITAEENRAKAEESAIRKLITDLIGESPETLDSIHEISSWILNDKTGAAAMATQINLLNDLTEGLSNALGEEINRATEEESTIKSKATHYGSFHFYPDTDHVVLGGKSVDGTNTISEKIPAATTEKAGVMSAEDKKEQVKKTPLVNGDIIVGQTREIYSRQGKVDSATFLKRTTAGSTSVSDGVASVKQIGGNIVKNLIDGTFESGWDNKNYNLSLHDSIVAVKAKSNTFPYITLDNTNKSLSVVNHVVYSSVYVKSSTDTVTLSIGGQAFPNLKFSAIAHDWTLMSVQGTITQSVIDNGRNYTSLRATNSSGTVTSDDYLLAKNYIVIDLTEMFGAGNEPTKEECDRMFGTMDALPQGITIAQPTGLKSTGFNQWNPANVLLNKSIVENAIEDDVVDRHIAIVECLPCKIGAGENNGYIIGYGEGDTWSEGDIEVYFSPLNPLDYIEQDVDLYMHKLERDSSKGTYVPQCKGYLLIVTPTTDKFCAHLYWSGDREFTDYEEYIESNVALPTIPQMSEWGLAAVVGGARMYNNLTHFADYIDLENSVYVKQVGRVSLKDFTFITDASNYHYAWVADGVVVYTRTLNVIDGSTKVYNDEGREAKQVGVVTAHTDATITVNDIIYTRSSQNDKYYYRYRANRGIKDSGILTTHTKPALVNNIFTTTEKGYLEAQYKGHDGELLMYDIRSSGTNVVIGLRHDGCKTAEEMNAFIQALPDEDAYVYYTLAIPEEYPIVTKTAPNYIGSDYGVEEFTGSKIPLAANILFYMRSLVGETRNFIDQLYTNTQKSDAKEVANYITNGIEDNKQLATNAPNLALRALFVAAGAEYNNTGADKTKTAPWGETVTHKAGHYYLNGLGDITEEQMMDIYKYSFPMLGATDWTNAFREVNVRTNLFYKQYYSAARIKTLTAAFNANKTIEIVDFNNQGSKVVLHDAASWNYAFGSCTKLKRILGVLDIKNASSLLGNDCDSLIHVRLYGLNKNLLLFNSSNNIDKESVLYAIQNASPTSAITITLHANAYARLAEDADIIEALEAQPLVTLVSA